MAKEKADAMDIFGLTVNQSASLALLSAPEYVVIECAKIEVAIQEILIKSLNDVSGVKSVFEKFKDGIDSLEMEIKTLEKNKEKKAEVKKINRSYSCRIQQTIVKII